ncbi:radical SAM protein [bacterium]|nr:radical SAM protein [bacterium]
MPFQKVNIEITNICNLQCSFCPEVIRPKSMMDLETFQKVLAEVSKVTRLVTFHLMGEPLVHPELRKFLDLCEEKKLRVFFVTNGVLLKVILGRSPVREKVISSPVGLQHGSPVHRDPQQVIGFPHKPVLARNGGGKSSLVTNDPEIRFYLVGDPEDLRGFRCVANGNEDLGRSQLFWNSEITAEGRFVDSIACD